MAFPGAARGSILGTGFIHITKQPDERLRNTSDMDYSDPPDYRDSVTLRCWIGSRSGHTPACAGTPKVVSSIASATGPPSVVLPPPPWLTAGVALLSPEEEGFMQPRCGLRSRGSL